VLYETLDQLSASALEALLPLTDYAGQYMLDYADLPDQTDELYRETLLAQRAYQRELERVRWLEAAFQEAEAKKDSLTSALMAGFDMLMGRASGTKRKSAETRASIEAILKISPQSSAGAELSYTAQTEQVARRLLAYRHRATRLAHLEKQYPQLARYYAATRRPVKPASLHLLYDTLKEYPLARGLAQGLADIFNIKSPAELLERPLFSQLCQQWEVERPAYLRSQLERVKAGQAELLSYARKVEAALG
jgi:hypothetical protein